MARQKRTAEELRAASAHLRYEIDMFMETAKWLAKGTSEQTVIHNAMVESFTIHTRALLDFLYSREPHDDDVIAEDFFGDPEQWLKTRRDKTELLGQVHRRVAKEIAHLTYVRQDITPEEKGWRFLEIANQLKHVIDEFLTEIPRDLLGKRWDDFDKSPGISPVTDTQ